MSDQQVDQKLNWVVAEEGPIRANIPDPRFMDFLEEADRRARQELYGGWSAGPQHNRIELRKNYEVIEQMIGSQVREAMAMVLDRAVQADRRAISGQRVRLIVEFELTGNGVPQVRMEIRDSMPYASICTPSRTPITGR